MLRFWKKRKDKDTDHKKHFITKSGKELLKDAETGLNSEWFRTQKYSLLKELEGVDKTKGIVDDKGRDNIISSILDLLERAYESMTTEDDQEGLKALVDVFLTAYMKIGKPVILDRYIEISEKIGVAKDDMREKLISAGDTCNHVDLAVNLYLKAGSKDKLTEIGDKALNIYLESKEMDLDAKRRLFDYVVEAYKSSDNVEKLIDAGDKALKIEMESHHFLHDRDWVLDAQKAYEAAGDKTNLILIGDQYVNLYLKEGMEIWLDKAIKVYKETDIDFASKFTNLAEKIEAKGHAEIADTFRRKIAENRDGNEA